MVVLLVVVATPVLPADVTTRLLINHSNYPADSEPDGETTKGGSANDFWFRTLDEPNLTSVTRCKLNAPQVHPPKGAWS